MKTQKFNKRKKLLAITFMSLLALTTSTARAAYSDDDGESYDSFQDIVNKLSKPQAQQPTAPTSTSRYSGGRSRLADTIFHAGAGYAYMSQVITVNDDSNKEYLQNQGFQVALGIDLLSPDWLAEGTVRNFDSNNRTTTKFSLKEFDLKFAYKPHIAEQLGVRLGGGLSARYSKYVRPDSNVYEYTTPASVFFGGFDIYISEMMSVGAEASVRTALIGQTPDQAAMDLTLRVDGHF